METQSVTAPRVITAESLPPTLDIRDLTMVFGGLRAVSEFTMDVPREGSTA